MLTDQAWRLCCSVVLASENVGLHKIVINQKLRHAILLLSRRVLSSNKQNKKTTRCWILYFNYKKTSDVVWPNLKYCAKNLEHNILRFLALYFDRRNGKWVHRFIATCKHAWHGNACNLHKWPTLFYGTLSVSYCVVTSWCLISQLMEMNKKLGLFFYT